MDTKTHPFFGETIRTIAIDDTHPALLAVNSVMVDFKTDRITHTEALQQINAIQHNPDQYRYEYGSKPHRIIVMDDEDRMVC